MDGDMTGHFRESCAMYLIKNMIVFPSWNIETLAYWLSLWINEELDQPGAIRADITMGRYKYDDIEKYSMPRKRIDED